MEESQKQETDSLGSGCSCDYKVSGFPKVLPESKSNCLALGWDLERGVPVAGRVAPRGAVPRGVVPRGVRGVASGASALLWVLEGLLGLRRGAHPVCFLLPFRFVSPLLSALACHSSPPPPPAAPSLQPPGSQPTPPPHSCLALPLASASQPPLVFSAPSRPSPCLLTPPRCPLPRVFLRPFPGTVKASLFPCTLTNPSVVESGWHFCGGFGLGTGWEGWRGGWAFRAPAGLRQEPREGEGA